MTVLSLVTIPIANIMIVVDLINTKRSHTYEKSKL